ncbi:MAG TPA: HAD family hydrolase [Planctomycetota bacterium]|nr:HAD family hydrolase [Planctomycetota bacterium]
MSDGLPVVLVDLDGTVLRSSAGRHAMLGAVAEVAGRPVDDMDRATFTGRTDAWIAAELLRRAGHPGDPEGVRRVHARYLELLEEHLLSRGCRATPGARALGFALRDAAADGRCHAHYLLTGNLREGARRKLAAAGLDDVFPVEGAFGDRHEDRAHVAAEAAGMAPAGARPVVLGDAPADLVAGRAIGARVVLVATGPVPAGDLRALSPDALLDDLSDTAAALAVLFG